MVNIIQTYNTFKLKIMTKFKISKKTALLFIYSLIMAVICNIPSTFNSGLKCVVSFMFMMAFTFLCIDTNESSDYSRTKVFLTILIGSLILEWPVRIVNFMDTFCTLPEELFTITGIFAGWLIACKRKIWLLIIIMSVILLAVHILYNILDLGQLIHHLSKQ